jgi:hypothetical protein
MNFIETKVSSRVVGMKCVNFRLVEGGTLILYLALPSESAGSTRLWIDCAWRFIDDSGVRVGSLDDPQSIVSAIGDVRGHVVTRINVDAITKDIRVELSDQQTIEAFCHSTQIEMWEIRSDDGYRLGVGPHLEMLESIVLPGEEIV